MKRKIEVDLTQGGLRELDGELAAYQKLILKRGADRVAKRLAEMGATKASLYFSRAIYTGKEDHTLEVIDLGGGAYKVRASGETVLFVEFGTGLMGGAHREARKTGMTPGSYSDSIGKGHWDDPQGWWLPRNKTEGYATHTYGNPANAPMYTTVKELELELERVVQEEFEI